MSITTINTIIIIIIIIIRAIHLYTHTHTLYTIDIIYSSLTFFGFLDVLQQHFDDDDDYDLSERFRFFPSHIDNLR